MNANSLSAFAVSVQTFTLDATLFMVAPVCARTSRVKQVLKCHFKEQKPTAPENPQRSCSGRKAPPGGSI